MNSLSRKELIKALVKGLKLDDNIFNYQAVAEEIEQLQEKDFMDFYKAVMSKNTYGNGLQVIINTVEEFNPKQIKSDLEVKAEYYIDLVRSMNNAVYNEHLKTGINFDIVLEAAKFIKVSEEEISILNNVSPYFNYKKLVANINCYQTTQDAIASFKAAITSKNTLAIDGRVSKMIGR